MKVRLQWKLKRLTMFSKTVFCISLLFFLPLVSSNAHEILPSVKYNKYIESIYKRAILNSDGTLGVRVHNRKIRVDHIVGFEAIRGEQKWNGNKAAFYFNISDSLLQTGKIVAAEFHLTVRPHLPTQSINLTLFTKQNDQTGKEIMYAVGWLVVRYTPQSQVSFDIRQTVQHWRHSDQLVAKLLLQVAKLNSDTSHAKNTIHMRNFFYSGARNGPCLVVYLEGTQDPPLVKKNKNFKLSQLPEAKPIQSPVNVSDESGRIRRASGNQCRRSDFMILLPDLFEGVIFPAKVSIGLCHGGCVFPINPTLTPTNHALIILVSYIQNGIWKGNRPFCVPTRYRAISVFAQKPKTSSYHLMTWKTAIITHCGCW